jgi:two-component system OmpR family response regulator
MDSIGPAPGFLNVSRNRLYCQPVYPRRPGNNRETKIRIAALEIRYKTDMEKVDHILIVDDDEEIRDLLGQYLEKHGFKVSTAANGRQMRAVLAMAAIDMIVLDLMLPGEDGLALCRSLHADGATPLPILMLTAKNEEADRILGLEMGADDYLTKPFATRELLARIRAVLRRARMVPASLQLRDTAQLLRFGAWRLDTHARHLLDENDIMVALSGAEYRLLRVFLEHPRRVLTRDQLLGLTQGREADVFDRSIDILVSRLRKRLRDDAGLIRTLRSEGYIFSADVTCGALAP